MAKRLNADEEKLLKEKAREAFFNAICPFSHFGVGCAILLNDGKIVEGFNIESSAYSATICAERVAMVSALSQYGIKMDDIKAIGIYLDSDKVAHLAEFAVNSYLSIAQAIHLSICSTRLDRKQDLQSVNFCLMDSERII